MDGNQVDTATDGENDALAFKRDLWASCNKMRGKTDAAEYKHVVLPLIFLKYISDSFEETHTKFIEKEINPEIKKEYTERNVFWVPKEARWKGIVNRENNANLGQIIDHAMKEIGVNNPKLENVLISRFGQSDLSDEVLGGVVDLFGKLPSFGNEDARSKDIIGSVYEYFKGKFAELEQRGGEFYTPPSVVRLLVEILDPDEGRLYDGCCGSGGMFIQSLKLKKKSLSVYGQESNPFTWRLAMMSLISNNIDADLADSWGDTLLDDLHKGEKADYVMTNPPFNLKDWGWESLQDDDRWKDWGVPPKGSANYAWILHHLHHLADRGTAGIVMSNGTLSTTKKEEKAIRQKIIEADKLDCVIMLPDRLFSNTGISACIWVLSNDKKDPKFRDRSGESLFIDCRGMGKMITRKLRQLTKEEVTKISETYQNWRSKDNYELYEDERGFCASVTAEVEIAEHDGIIVPGRYVGAPPLPDDGEPFEEKMEHLTKELKEYFAESRRLEKELQKNLEDLGYEL
tara:strand:+ start:1274 stop:2818 length:1545 start_codon:yes stop_codon:yes gene_type:complete